MGQSSLNASHDVFIGRPGKIDPSSYWSEVHSFSSDLDQERTCREKLSLRSTSERVGSIVRPGQLATVDDALGEGALGGSLAAGATWRAADSRVGAPRGHRAASQGAKIPR